MESPSDYQFMIEHFKEQLSDYTKTGEEIAQIRKDLMFLMTYVQDSAVKPILPEDFDKKLRANYAEALAEIEERKKKDA